MVSHPSGPETCLHNRREFGPSTSNAPDGYRRLNAIDENAISPNARLQSA
jgi:hypothetical protein